MNPKSATALVWAAVATTLLGLVVMSPAGQFALFIIAIVLAIAPTLFGRRVARVAGGVTLAIAAALAYQAYPAFEKETDNYRKRAEARGAKAPAQTPGQQQR